MADEEVEKYFEDKCGTYFEATKAEIKEDVCNAFKDGYNKANEWHYPSKGEYPKDNGNVLLWCEPKFKEQHTKGGYLVLGYWSDSRFVQFSPKNDTIIAWKEIVLPKESEE